MKLNKWIKRAMIFSLVAISCVLFAACGDSEKKANSASDEINKAEANLETEDYIVSEPDKFTYESIDGGITITGYEGDVDILNVPESIDGMTVIEIYSRAFYISSIKEVNLPDTIITIGERAFCYCEELERISLGNSVQKIENGAISMCESLKEISIPKSVTEIGSMIFSADKNLEKIEFNASTEVIPGNAFADTKIGKFVVSDSVKTINDYAFDTCTNLSEIEIPASVTSIGDETFEEGIQLTIVGEKGSYAEEYANKKGYTFVEK